MQNALNAKNHALNTVMFHEESSGTCPLARDWLEALEQRTYFIYSKTTTGKKPVWKPSK